jgi:aminoglycoside phosphotransferase (APT) family kinase protein
MRRPTTTAISATANDLGREFRILSALADQLPRRAIAFAAAGS